MEIPITWATVGHLFLEDVAGGGRQGAPEDASSSRLDHPAGDGQVDWGLGTDMTLAPTIMWMALWYCPDLIEQILSSKVRHELGSHSFSHISFLAENSTPDLVEQEVAQCQAAMAPYHLSARSLVYPYNQMGHHYAPILADLGITCVRHRDPAVRLVLP